ncbi:MAG: hypothetical protein R6U66_08395 [Bacteroidales bacterium]
MNRFERIWILLLATIVASLSVVYVLTHMHYQGQREVVLTAEQVNTVRSIPDSSFTEKQSLRAIMAYLSMNQSIDVDALNQEVEAMGLRAFLQALPSVVLKVDSCFWLVGKMMYWEIIFWSLFGVLANALYHSAQRIRRKQFKRSEMVVYISKLLYAPFVVMVIFLSHQALIENGDLAEISTGHGAVVVSFILGFFSSRAIGLLNKLKDLLLPRMAATNEQATIDTADESQPLPDWENAFCQLPQEQQLFIANLWLDQNRAHWESDEDRVEQLYAAVPGESYCYAIVVKLKAGVEWDESDYPAYVNQFYEEYDYEIPVRIQEDDTIH